MTPIPLSQISELEDGLPIPMVYGRLKVVFERKEGEGEYGPWSFQSAVLQCGDQEAQLKFKNMDEMKPLEGKDITIRANKSKQHGLTGIVKAVEQYQGKTYHKILLTPSCKILVDLPNGNKEEADDLIPMTHDSKGESLPGVDEARRHLMQSCHLYNLCVDAVNAVIEPHLGEKINPDLYQAAVGTLYIEASRAGLVGKMPDKPSNNKNNPEPF